MDESDIRNLLEAVKRGQQTIDSTVAKLRRLPYEDLGFAKVDHHRGLRQGYAEVVFACLDGKPVGFALFFHNFSTFLGRPGIYLEDLFVLPEARGHGVGRKVLTWLAGEAVKRNCGRLENPRE